MKNKLFALLLTSLILTACNNKPSNKNLEFTTETKPELIQPTKMSGVRNNRYCEILIVSGKIGKLEATVYNTIGCNDCPKNLWKKIDQEKIKKQFDAKSVVMNGPRVFLMDSIGQFNSSPPKVNLGGIEMIKRAKISISLRKVMDGKSEPYEENVIKRKTKYIFNKGSQVYLLHHKNKTYIMQSYALIVKPNLNEEILKSFGSILKLPSGWSYETKVLEESLILETKDGGEAFVIQDDYQNSYQKISK
jgi:hypothetical protein